MLASVPFIDIHFLFCVRGSIVPILWSKWIWFKIIMGNYNHFNGDLK